MTNQNNIKAAAEALRNARASGQAIGQVTASHGIAGVDAAYAVQDLNVAARIADGGRLVGKKIGLTSTAVQKQLGVDQPDFGMLFADMEYLDGDVIPFEHLIQPKAEAEIAFVVDRDLTGEVPNYSEFVASLAYALPALEIVDSAIADWKLTLEDTVSDNASCGVYVLGNQPTRIGDVSLAEVQMQLRQNGQLTSEGTGLACLGHPLRAAYWLARTMASRGEGLRAGEVILSGALGPMVALSAGDELQVDISGLGGLTCRIE